MTLDTDWVEPRPDWYWLASTVRLQREAYGWDWDEIRSRGRDAFLAELGGSIRMNVTAAIAELGEMLQELGPTWKTWVTKPSLASDARDAAVEELVDTAHFLANILISLGVTDDEWQRRYEAKQQKNRDRQASGTYDGVVDKCPRCHRAYDGAGVECRPASTTDIVIKNDDEGNSRTAVAEVRPYCSSVGHYV